MRRFMLFLAGAALILTATPAPASASASASAELAACVSGASATFRHTFNGPAGTATITATRPLCAGQTRAFSLISYTAGSSGLYRYDTAQATITATRPSVRLKVTVPPCATHVYAVTGTAVATETSSSAAYPTPLARYEGGSTECRPLPRVVFTNSCTGTVTATVTNAPDANIAAVLTSGTRSTRIAPGRSTTLTARKGSTLTFRVNTFTTYVGTWRTPTTPCITTPAASASPAAPVVRRPSPTASSPTPTPSRSSTAATTPVAFSTTPAALTPETPTDLPETGMGLGSLILIAIGLLMIAGGILTLARLIRPARAAR